MRSRHLLMLIAIGATNGNSGARIACAVITAD